MHRPGKSPESLAALKICRQGSGGVDQAAGTAGCGSSSSSAAEVRPPQDLEEGDVVLAREVRYAACPVIVNEFDGTRVRFHQATLYPLREQVVGDV